MAREQFHLSGVELWKFGGLTAVYSMTDSEGSSDYKVTLTKSIHPDLSAIFAALRNRAEFSLGFPAQEVNEDERYLVNVIGVKVNSGTNPTFVISAIIDGPVGNYKTKTPKLSIKEDDQPMIDRLEDEVYAYLFEGKSAQLSIFGDEPDGVFAD